MTASTKTPFRRVDADWRSELNEAQLRAVEHEEGPLLVPAGAGTGKTKTVAFRVGRLIERGVSPERILLLTFTRRAAAEMIARAGSVVGEEVAGQVWHGTFHGVGYRLLRTYGKALGLGEGFSVIDEGDAADLMGLVRDEVVPSLSRRRFARRETLLRMYSRLVNTQTCLSDVLLECFPSHYSDERRIAEVFDGYMNRKRSQHLLDFDDLLVFWRTAVTGGGKVASTLQGLFDHVLVDEYQDTNAVQADILQAMTRHSHSVMAVGDDAQAIYAFRGATIRNILDFPKRNPGTEIVKLEQNYRSTPQILAVANAVMAEATDNYTKRLYTSRPDGALPGLVRCRNEQGEATAVCDAVLDAYENGVPLQEQAVVFRAAAHSVVLELELQRRNIPFKKYGGLKFMEAAHVKDLVAVLRILENPFDELAWFRTLQLFSGVGPKTARRLLVLTGVNPTQPDAESPITQLGDAAVAVSVPATSRDDLVRFAGVLTTCLADDTAPTMQIEGIRTVLDDLVRDRYDRADTRLRDFDQLEHFAAAYTSRAHLVTDVLLDPPAATSNGADRRPPDDDHLILSTVHSTKAGEWDIVHVINATDGMFPSTMAIGDHDQLEEERRLFYVAVTRARNELHIYFPMEYARRNDALDACHVYPQPTRFLPRHTHQLFEQRTPLPTTTASPPRVELDAPRVSVPESVDRAVADLWHPSEDTGKES